MIAGHNILAAVDARGLLEALLQGDLPTRERYLADLAGMHEIMAVLLVIVGVVYLLQGWRIFKALVILNAAVLGGFLGYRLGLLSASPSLPIITAIAGTLLLGVLAWPMMRAAISLMGALAGGVAGYGLWSYAAAAAGREGAADHAWAGALLGVVTLGLLAFIIFKAVVILFTGLQGSLMAVSGIIAVLLKPYAMADRLYAPLLDNHHLLPLLIGVPAVMGWCLQYISASGGGKKK